MSVRFRSLSASLPFSGVGLSVDLGSGGVLVATTHPIMAGALVEMSFEWPWLLDGKVPLQMIAAGRVLRRATAHFAATFERYEFHTMKCDSTLTIGRPPKFS
jgi:hypothetical protein